MKSKNLINSFQYAFNGIQLAFQTERNMKIHFGLMVFVIVIGILLKISIQEWIVCILCFACVIGAEMFNTAIEKTVDLAMPKRNDTAKLAKDISAGAVLVFAIGSIIVGLLIFVPKLIDIFK